MHGTVDSFTRYLRITVFESSLQIRRIHTGLRSPFRRRVIARHDSRPLGDAIPGSGSVTGKPYLIRLGCRPSARSRFPAPGEGEAVKRGRLCPALLPACAFSNLMPT